MATLMYVPTEHVPVLATELIDLLDPHPGETAVDCTFGGGGHARLVAERLGAAGTLVCIDRDPAAQRHFDELAGEVECELRLIRADFASALASHRSSWTRPNAASPTPTTPRSTCGWIRASHSPRRIW